MEGLETPKSLSPSTATLVTNVPKREESRAKRHFEKHEINDVKRWKCKYCVTNYGLTTSTSSLWKHLEHKHKEKLSAEDIKQKSGHENIDKSAKSNYRVSEGSGSSSEFCSQILENHHSIANNHSCDTINIYSDGSTAVGKRKYSTDAYSNVDKVAHKRLVGYEGQQLTLFNSRGTERRAELDASSMGFLNLVTDIATIQPSEFESFQDLLVQNVFLQPSGPYIFPNVEHVDIMRDRILSTQRNRVIDIVGQQCGWKFDMNIYPLCLKDKTLLGDAGQIPD
ncbi:hypothetical protein CHUAL_000912 [Chamberlinius hualienensis]